MEEAVAGGAAVAWLSYGGSERCCGGENFLPSLFFSFSVAFSSSVCFLCFRFRFLYSRFVPALLSLSFVISLLPLSSGPPLSFGLSPFIGERKEQVCLLLVRLQSRNGWSASDPFGGLKVWGFGGGEEREAGRFENGFRLLLLLIQGERRKMNSVIQNDTVLVFIYIYIISETTSF